MLKHLSTNGTNISLRMALRFHMLLKVYVQIQEQTLSKITRAQVSQKF